MTQVVIERRSKRYKEAAKKAIVDPVPVDQAIDALKAFNPTKFDQSVELIFSLGIDAKTQERVVSVIREASALGAPS